MRRGLHAGGKVDRVQHVGDRAALQIDRRVAGAVGDDVAADARAGRDVAQPAGAGAFLKVMVLPLTFSVEPSWISLPSEARWWCGAAVTVVLPAPSAVVRPSALRKSALPVTLRSAPVELCRVTLPAADRRRSGADGWRSSPAPAADRRLLTPLARSIAVTDRSTVAVEACRWCRDRRWSCRCRR